MNKKMALKFETFERDLEKKYQNMQVKLEKLKNYEYLYKTLSVKKRKMNLKIEELKEQVKKYESQ